MSHFEKDMTTKREGQSSEELERITTVYDDNYHGLTLKTILVYLVCIDIIIDEQR